MKVFCFVMLIVGGLAYVVAEKNKWNKAFAAALALGIPLGAVAEGLANGEAHVWMAVMLIFALYLGIKIGEK